MAVTIDATVGGSSSNSFVTLERAKEILDVEIGATAWTGATDDDKRKQALIQATRIISTFSLLGTKNSCTQSLHFPAVHYKLGTMSYDNDGNLIIPEEIEYATCFAALWILRHENVSGANEEILMGITNSSIGGASRAGGSRAAASIGPMSLMYLRKFIQYTGKFI